MPLSSGASFGPYAIVAPLGAGGMGEVYRARDTKLGRDVAIKVLPASFSDDPDRLGRFEREARTLASLNHPNIGAIYGLEEIAGVRALVLELVEGPTLAEVLVRGPVPLDSVLPLARQMAAALEAAHASGIIHRDLKPANIKIRPDGTLKILDFGLAKALAGESVPDAAALLPTITLGGTLAGTVVGTPAYMSPEQARAQPVDARTDVWAFGCVLYEMLSGRRAFSGDTISDVIARVLEREPDFQALPEDTSPAIRRLLARCLAKDSSKRLHAIADARLEIDDALLPVAAVQGRALPPMTAPARRGRWAVHLAWGLVTAAVALAVTMFPANAPPVPRDVVAMTVAPPRGTTFPQGSSGGWPMISPDGQRLAFVALEANSEPRLWLRRLDSPAARVLEGTQGAMRPFWSPDSRYLGYFANGQLLKVDADSGLVQVLADAPYLGGLAGTWGDGVIVWKGSDGFRRVPADGGAATLLLLDADENNPSVPTFLPDGRRFLYTRLAPREDDSRVCVASLDSTETPCILQANAPVRYAPGYLLLIRNGTLVAQPFDAGTLTVSGEAFPVASDVASDQPYSPPAFSVSSTGVLAYASERLTQPLLAWRDRNGTQLDLPLIQGFDPSLSSDGQRLIVQRRDPQTGNRDLWLIDLAGNNETLFTFERGNESGASFSADGARVVYASQRPGEGDSQLFMKPIGGQGPVEPLAVSGSTPDWSPTGEFILYQASNQSTRPGINFDIMAIRLDGDRTPFPVAQTEHGERSGRFSPGDDSWIAYDSTESGRREIWVQRFMDPEGGSRRRVSVNGGVNAAWRRDGQELFYVAADGTMMAVPIMQRGSTLEWGSPRGLFKTGSAGGNVAYAVSRDGGRFLVPAPPDPEDIAPITLVVNWPATLRR